MIPKVIHYCWFGGNPLPKLAKKCIKSWKKYCKDYEIIEWNEKNFDIDSAPLYVRQAYEAKKWAFVTDYVRLYAITTCGGIYMDTDVEVVKSLDPFLKHHAFSGFEDDVHIPTGIMACEKDFAMFKKLMEYYNTAVFVNPDGSYNETTNTVLITQQCLEKGLKQNNMLQEIDGFVLYPNIIFCPLNCQTRQNERTKDTVTIHWFSGSWWDEGKKNRHRTAMKNINKANRIHFLKTLPNRIFKAILGEPLYNKIKEKIR